MRHLLLAMMLLLTLTAQDCGEMGDMSGMLDRPGSITVTNAGPSEVAVVAIMADDVKSHPTLAAGQSATVQTNVGGQYDVRVVMTPENAAAYREELSSLRKLVEQSLAGTADPGVKTRLFTDLAGINASIAALENQQAAGCSGRIELNTEEAASVSATVTWSKTAGGGFWDVSCGSN